MNNSLIPENTAFAIALSGCQDPESRQCQQEKKLLWAPEIWGEHCARQRYGPSLHICYSSRFLGLQRSVLGWSRCCCGGFCRVLWAVGAGRELVRRAARVAQTGEVSAGKKPAGQN